MIYAKKEKRKLWNPTEKLQELSDFKKTVMLAGYQKAL